MSQLIGKLTRFNRGTTQALGFRASHQVSQKNQILIIASLDPAGAESPAEYAAGADAILLRRAKPGPGAELNKIAKALHDTPWGEWVEAISEEDRAELARSGADFLVFPTSCPVTGTEDSKMGKILQIDTSISDGMLRAVNELAVDAILVTGKKEIWRPLTWQTLLLVRRLAGMIAKPVLIALTPDVTAGELKTLWDAGIDGVVLELGKGQSPEELKKLYQAVSEESFSTRKRGKAEAIVPHLGSASSEVEEEEDE